VTSKHAAAAPRWARNHLPSALSPAKDARGKDRGQLPPLLRTPSPAWAGGLGGGLRQALRSTAGGQGGGGPPLRIEQGRVTRKDLVRSSAVTDPQFGTIRLTSMVSIMIPLC
jgi:hypothetical protein